MGLLFFCRVKARIHTPFWRLNPLVAVTLLFASGILLGKCIVSFHFFFWGASLLTLLPGYLLFQVIRPENVKKRKIYSSAIVSLLCLFSGAFTSTIHAHKSKNHIDYKSLKGEYVFRLITDSYGKLDSSEYRCEGRITHTLKNGEWSYTPCKVKCKLNISKQKVIPDSKVLFVRTSLDFPIFNGKSEFNYHDWLVSNGVGAVVSVNSNWVIVAPNHDIYYLAQKLRRNLLEVFKNSEYRKDQVGLAGALLLGDRSTLDAELLHDFSASGIIHLLAVSGLHVGLIHQGFLWLLSICGLVNERRRHLTILAVPLLWVYAFVSGLSPSVVRAAIMLSIGSVAGVLRFRKHPFNVLAAAAIIILPFSPDLITHPGFLLSFSAVAGILFSGNRMQKINQIKSRFLRWLIGSAAISVSAQIATLPVSLFIFGKFPMYFLPANLLAVPLASLISFAGFLSLILHPVQYIGETCIWVMMTSIEFLIIWSQKIASLPFASASIPKPDIAQSVLLALFVVFILIGSKHLVKAGFKLLLLVLIFNSCLQILDNLTGSLNQTSIDTVLNVSNKKSSLKFLTNNQDGFVNVRLGSNHQARKVWFKFNKDLIQLKATHHGNSEPNVHSIQIKVSIWKDYFQQRSFFKSGGALKNSQEHSDFQLCFYLKRGIYRLQI